jgi:aromatic-amino-acid transaminase
MSNFIMAEQNSRVISGDDKIFGINKLAQDMVAKVGKENVINATIGSLLDDDGNLIVLSSIVEVLRSLKPVEYADYAPIAGVPAFLEKVRTAAFGAYAPEGFTEAVATPGGTGAIRNTIQNYSKRGDSVLTSDWYWSPYKTIAEEIERKIATYTMFDENSKFNIASFDAKITELLAVQSSLVILFNAPAHNPTGFSPTLADWDLIIDVLKKKSEDKTKKIIFFVDIAYIDFAGDPDQSRTFLPKLSGLPENILVVFGFSMSKGYTIYGMRSGAMICLTQNKAIADEFKMVCMFSNRGTWSNGTRPAMMSLIKVYDDPALLARVTAEREDYSEMLASRGAAFMAAAKEAGLTTCPFSSGFFITVLFENAEAVGVELQKDGVFAVPIGKGIRVAISAISADACRKVAYKMAEAVKRMQSS